MNPALLWLTVAVAAPALKDPPKAEAPLLGDWVLTEWLQRGTKMAFAEGTGVEFLPGGKRLWRDGPAGADERQYKLYPKTSPAEIDLIRTDVGAQPQVYPCIFQIDGDRLVIAVGTVGGDRPNEFDPAKATMLMTFTRVKKKD